MPRVRIGSRWARAHQETTLDDANLADDGASLQGVAALAAPRTENQQPGTLQADTV